MVKENRTGGLSRGGLPFTVEIADVGRMVRAMSQAEAFSDIDFRLANFDDIDDIVELVETAFRRSQSRSGWTTEVDLLGGERTDHREVQELMENPSVRLVVATRGEEIVGTVVLRDEGPLAYVGMLAVNPSLQARGIGRELLRHAEELAIREFSAKGTQMTVIMQRVELIHWYEKRGYRMTNQREPFPYGDPEFGLPLRPDLEYVVLEKPFADAR